VVIGTAVTAVVTAIVTNIINPLIAALGGNDIAGLSWTVVAGNPKSTIDFAAVITALINFLVIAAVVYFAIVVPVKKIQQRRKRAGQAETLAATEVELLTEIRDLLQSRQSSS